MSVDIIIAGLPWCMRDGANSKEAIIAARWWRTPLNPALRTQRQGDVCEFKASLVYIVSSRPSRLHTKTLSMKQKKAEPQSTSFVF